MSHGPSYPFIVRHLLSGKKYLTFGFTRHTSLFSEHSLRSWEFGFPPNGGLVSLVREIPLFQGNPGW